MGGLFFRSQAPLQDVGAIMRRVIYALLPAMLVHIYFFGWGLLWNLMIGIGTAVLVEALLLLVRQRPLRRHLADASAALTAVLLAFAIPPLAPWWLVVLANLIAITFGKQLYGGLGFNPFNPAMVGYAMCLVSFPLEMSQWPKPQMLQTDTLTLTQSWQWVFAGGHPPAIDMISTASPLETWRSQRSLIDDIATLLNEPLFGYWGNAGGEWVALAILLGGLWLLQQGIIRWHIPLAMLTALVSMAGLFHWLSPEQYPAASFHLVAGATMLGAFFIATDPVTGPASPRAQLVYGAGIGMLVFIIRSWGGYPDGVAFAVLIMNMTAPMLDRYLQPRVYGTS